MPLPQQSARSIQARTKIAQSILHCISFFGQIKSILLCLVAILYGSRITSLASDNFSYNPSRGKLIWRCLSENQQIALDRFYQDSNGQNWESPYGNNPTEGWFVVDENSVVYMASVLGYSGPETITQFFPGSVNFSGVIPDSIGSLNSLTQLLLFGNPNLVSPLPESLANLTALEYLNLNDNGLSGSIPGFLGSLTQLKRLYLEENDFSGEIPAELGQLTNLEDLEVNGNQLTGELPASLGNLTSLKELEIFNNQISGAVPASFSNLTALEYFYAGGNSLTDITALENLPNIKVVSVSNNNIDFCEGSENFRVMQAMQARGVIFDTSDQQVSPCAETSIFSPDIFEDEDDGNIDPGDRSLREMVNKALEYAIVHGSAEVRFTKAGSPYQLTLGSLDLEIPGDTRIEIRTNGVEPKITSDTSGLFDLSGQGEFYVQGVTFSSQKASCIQAESVDVTVFDCKFQDSKSDDGGSALSVDGETVLKVQQSHFARCGSPRSVTLPDGLKLRYAGTIEGISKESEIQIQDCILENCRGHGIVTYGQASVERSTIRNFLYEDTVSEVDEGWNGIVAAGGTENAPTKVTLKRSVVGACLNGIFLSGYSFAESVNSVILGNHESGIVSYSEAEPAFQITHSTIAINGFGIVDTDHEKITLSKIGHCIVASNRSDLSAEYNDQVSRIESLGYNFIGIYDEQAIAWLASDLIGSSERPNNPEFSYGDDFPLKLLPNSKAINAGDPAFDDSTITTDFRGAARVIDDRIDIGAYEAPALTITNLFLDFFQSTPDLADPEVDANGNGLANLADLALGNDPAENAQPSGNPKSMVDEGKGLVIEFPLNERLTEIEYAVQGSPTLESWVTGATYKPKGAGEGFERTAGAGGTFVSATQDGPVWTIRERISNTFGRMAFRDPESHGGLNLPDIRLSSSSLTFGEVTVGIKATTSFAVYNDADGLLQVSGIGSEGNSDISISPKTFSVPSGSFQEVTIDLTAQSEGILADMLTLTSNDPDESSIQMALEGHATANTGSGNPDFRLSTTTLDLGDLTLGIATNTSFVVFNDGDADLEVSGITVSGTPGITVDPETFSVTPGTSQTVMVSFTPETEGLLEILLDLSNNDPEEPESSVTVQGNVSMDSEGNNLATVEMVALSLHIAVASSEQDGQAMTLLMDSGIDPEATETYNQKLYYDPYLETPSDLLLIGTDPDFPSHLASVLITDSSENTLFSGVVEVDVPGAVDSNANGLPDFFEKATGLPETQTTGFVLGFLSDDIQQVEGDVTVTWLREPDSLTGGLVLEFSLDGGTVYEFSTTFDLVEYTGILDYARDSESGISGSWSMKLTPNPDVELFTAITGNPDFEIDTTDALTLGAGEILGNSELLFTYGSFPVTRITNQYLSTLLAPLDSTSSFDSWILQITDENDGDGDVVPDFSDEPLP